LWSFETNRELKFQRLRHTLKQFKADPASAGFDPRDRRMTHAGSLGHFALGQVELLSPVPASSIRHGVSE
jgi:hypothetical protein